MDDETADDSTEEESDETTEEEYDNTTEEESDDTAISGRRVSGYPCTLHTLPLEGEGEEETINYQLFAPRSTSYRCTSE